MVLAVFVHMFTVIYMKAYRKPREFTWWTGLGLMGLVMTFGFSGYLLPMDELAYFATKVGLAIPQSLPGMGAVIERIVQGGPEVTTVTIQRFFALHVVVLPLVFFGLLAAHLYLVTRHGNAVPPSVEALPESERRSIPFFPNFMMKDMAMWLITLNVITILAMVYPWPLGPPADPLAPAPEGIHPEWYFMSQFALLELTGQWFSGALGKYLGIVLFGVGAVLWGLIPLYDTGSRAGRRARTATWFGLFAVIGLIGLTLIGYWNVWQAGGH
jgi:cytochrome b6